MVSRPVALGRIRGGLALRPTLPSPGTSLVSKVTVWMRPVWLDTTRSIWPAPTRAGDTWTKRSCTAAVSVTGVAGRAVLVRGLPPPQAVSPARTSTAPSARAIGGEGSATRIAVRPVRGGCWRVRARAASRLRRVPRRRHRDERPAWRALRAHGGGRGAGGRGRAARRVAVAGRRRGAAGPGHPALHRDLAGDGGRRAAARGGVARVRRAAARAGARGPQRPVRQAGPPAGGRPRGPGLAGPAGAVHGGAGPPVRAAAAAPRAVRAGRGAGHRGRAGAPRAAGRAHVRAGLLRAVRAAVRERADGGRRADAAGPPPAAPSPAGRGPPPARRAPAPQGAPARAGRLPVPRRRRARALRRKVDRPAHALPRALHLRR